MAEKNPFEGQSVEALPNSLQDRLEPRVENGRLVGFEVLRSDYSVLDETFEIIKAHLDGHAPFTNAQLDICTQVLATMLPASERGMLREISEQNNYPLWVGLLAQWRRIVEYSEQYAILIDPDWQEKIDSRVQEVNGAVLVVDEKE